MNPDVETSRKVIILRGCASSGKSTFAKWISDIYDFGALDHNQPASIVCTADDFFTDIHGNYNFDVNKLGFAHSLCQTKFESALKNGVGCVIVANTNTKQRDFQFYIDKAKEYNYPVVSLVVEKRHENKNSHLNGCPDFVLEKQENDLKSNLKLR